MLKLFRGNKENWYKVLPGILLAYRTSKQASTKYKYYLMHGRVAKLPIHCLYDDT